ncbi:MAG: membrane dipeptidase, partial [Candidatus Pacebacteria bacterium]|nr:membrane dipeptidase [Candidatus Paceibacterota bacterium]
METTKKRLLVCADTMAFPAPQGSLPKFSDDGPPDFDLAVVTAAPPVEQACSQTNKGIVQEVEAFRSVLEDQGVTIVKSSKELLSEKKKVILSLQHPPQDTVSAKEVAKAGIRICALAYDRQNAFGGGFNSEKGLTKKGRSLIESFEKYNIILDLSHSNHRTAREALDFIKEHNLRVPVMASHGGCYEIYPHPRNLPDDILAEIAHLGGIVGIATLPFILGEEPPENKKWERNIIFDMFLNHLEHALGICGPKSVCIGSDGIYGKQKRGPAKKHFEKMKRLVDKEGSFGS